MRIPSLTSMKIHAALGLIALGALLAPGTVLSRTWAARASQLSSRELSKDEIGTLKVDEYRDTRNKISMRRIDPADQGVDWDTDPTAIPFMLYQIRERTELEITVNNDGLDLATEDIFEHLVVYLTSHQAWSLNEKETENLAKWLKRGGTLLLDDCYNKGSPFTDSVQPEVGKLVPGAEPIILLQSDKKVSDIFSMVYKTQWPGSSLKFMRPWQYFMLDDRPAVFFTPNDDGCAWEISTPPTASNPVGEGIGHGGDNRQRELFYKWITNWMMYIYSH